MSPFTKRTDSAPDGFYAVEAAGLAWLAAAGPGSAPVGQVIEVSRTHIVLERLQPVAATPSSAAQLGTALAVTHAAGAAAFGQPPDNWSGPGFIGRQPMSLSPTARWGQFYAEQRLLPYARKAHQIGHLSSSGLAIIESLSDRLTAGEFDDDRPPARIHGDLWAGNVVFCDTGAVLVDPAAHGGHGLTDIAMLELFGAPQVGHVTAAYAEAARLPADWRDLLGLHQLHPLLTHAVTHAPAYGSQAVAVAQTYL